MVPKPETRGIAKASFSEAIPCRNLLPPPPPTRPNVAESQATSARMWAPTQEPHTS